MKHKLLVYVHGNHDAFSIASCSFYNITSLLHESDLFSNINVLKEKIRIKLYLHVNLYFIYGYGMKCI